MKTIFKTFLTFCMLMMMTVGLCEAAASAETIDNGEEVAKVKRIAVAYPDYYKTLDTEPTISEFIELLYEASKGTKHFYVISYDEVADKIKADTGIDIKVLKNTMEARKIYKEHIYKYADAYVIVTLANNSRVTMFCDAYLANSNERIYSLQIQSGKRDSYKTTKEYKTLAEQFYKALDKAVQSEAKKLKENNK
ncbi:MAG: coenzyme F(420) biosynthesis enzyme [Selenomonadaceae bacterium]|nr:coenzyme F(420) biosynthesis enzyme [Selenomonadaceae bacterium]MBR1859584.1 coenzyme F(420) biosynthesis enzyme [Selenomonadaceae bacterium]